MKWIKWTRGTYKRVEAFVKLQCEYNGCGIRRKKEQDGQMDKLRDCIYEKEINGREVNDSKEWKRLMRNNDFI